MKVGPASGLMGFQRVFVSLSCLLWLCLVALGFAGARELGTGTEGDFAVGAPGQGQTKRGGPEDGSIQGSSRAGLEATRGGATGGGAQAGAGRVRQGRGTKAGNGLNAAKPGPDDATTLVKARAILATSLKRAAGGGLPGAAAGVVQVVLLMWLRTVVNYQARYGTSMFEAMAELYSQGGVGRFYQGLPFAVVQNPLAKFGMTAANEGALALSESLPRFVPMAATTWLASLAAGMWRMALTPLDTCKTVLQVEGPDGFAKLLAKVRSGDVSRLYQGAIAAAAATAVGHYPWFLTFNYLNRWLRVPASLLARLLRNALIGLAASVASDLCSNSIRVLKTTKQAAASYEERLSYVEAVTLILEADGWKGLMGRGLSTRILANGLQSMIFTVVWRAIIDKYFAKPPPPGRASTSSATRLSRGGGTARGGKAVRRSWTMLATTGQGRGMGHKKERGGAPNPSTC